MNIQLNIQPIESWVPQGKSNALISGPCSAESEQQMLDVARAIVKQFPHNIFRAGIWKPRTRPNAFEGVGAIGLEWMKAVKQETGMPVATEVANAKHVEECLKNGIDVLWVGARTTVNPFSVQEIADALKGVDIPVLVKNPVNPDLQLWIGALERMNQAGITKLAAIHRGFSPLTKTKYRNTPNWKIPIELKRLIPELAIICDPSHIAGNTELIQPISQKAYDLEMNGLMIETHCNPAVALSDAKQQITPPELDSLIHSLVVRKESTSSTSAFVKLEKLRKKIDSTDTQILELLAQRMQVVEQIGDWKKTNGITILQLSRWEELLNERLKVGQNLAMEEAFVRKIFDAIHEESINIQAKVLNTETVIE